MKIAFLVNDVTTEKSKYTTTRLALKATEMGHEVWYLGADDFAYDPDESLMVRAHRSESTDLKGIVEALSDPGREPARIDASELDVLFLRNDPGEDPVQPAWTKTVGAIFGAMAVAHGVLVVNDPTGLALATNKMYFHHFPSSVRPRTLVTRDRDEVQRFLDDRGGRAVMKPLQGSGGLNVFMVTEDDAPNVNQMFEAIARDGYVVVQEYLDAAECGDLRIFVMNGRVLRVGDSFAAFRRSRGSSSGDFRSNVSVGAEPEAARVDDTMLRIVDECAPKLVEDGMFLVGLDLVGDKLLEVNVFSPGGLGSAQKVTGADFTPAVIESLERKVELRKKDGQLTNRELATM